MVLLNTTFQNSVLYCVIHSEHVSHICFFLRVVTNLKCKLRLFSVITNVKTDIDLMRKKLFIEKNNYIYIYGHFSYFSRIL